MKKLLSMILASVLIFTLAGCGGGEEAAPEAEAGGEAVKVGVHLQIR